MITAMNVSRQYASIQKELDRAVLDVLHSGQYILGKSVENFEKSFAEYCDVKYAVGVGNGSDALVMALKACGVKPGDEVITTAMSFSATAEAITSVGAVQIIPLILIHMRWRRKLQGKQKLLFLFIYMVNVLIWMKSTEWPKNIT